jgi:IS5 family transposase
MSSEKKRGGGTGPPSARDGAMKQVSLAQGGFDRCAKTTRRAAFLAEMERVIPCGQLCALIQADSPGGGHLWQGA